MQAGAAPKEPPRSTRRSSLLKRSQPGVPMPSVSSSIGKAASERRSGSQVLYRTYEENGRQGNGESGTHCTQEPRR